MTLHIKTWWGQKFLKVLESFLDRNRVARGRQFLASHRISDWEVRGNRVEARIRGHVSHYFGSYDEPVYETAVEFIPLPDAAWEDAIREIGARAGFVARLLFDEMPEGIEKPLSELGYGLLPTGREDIILRCTCPDLETPCRHLAGLLHLLAGHLDRDPFLLFELRGLSRSELSRRLKASPLGSALAPSHAGDSGSLSPAESFFTRPRALSLPELVSPKEFWRGSKRLPVGVEVPEPAPVAGILIRKGGDYPAFWNKDESFVDAMEGFYEQVRKQTKDWL